MMCTPYGVYFERCFLSMIAFKLTTRLKGKATPFGTCGIYCGWEARVNDFSMSHVDHVANDL